MLLLKNRLAIAAGIASVALVGGLFASASSSAKSKSKPAPTTVSATTFTTSYSTMKLLKPIVKKGKGSIEVILPDTVSSTRYTEFDAPSLTEAFIKAGLTFSQFRIQNAQGSDATELTDAQAAISSGARVLVVDPLDSGVGAQIESYAKAHGVKVIDYDRLTLGGTRGYYVSFNNTYVGTLLGKGLVACTKAWNVSSPKVIVMRGAPTDNNATLFANGYEGVLKPLFSSGWTDVADPAGTWTPSVAETEFQQAFTANPSTNAALLPNDENAAPIISYLQSQGVKPQQFPVTGQDATLVGLQNILAGYQCGTVYKPIFLEAQAAASLAIYARANAKPPKALVNGTTPDSTSNINVPSVLLTPEWVTTANMEKTIIKDGFVPAVQLCAGSYAADCTKYKIH
jgi:D-xylose transport system substrate-binding protein